MALSLGDIDTWDSSALEEFSHQLERRTRTLEALGESVRDAATIPEWSGVGADAARESFTRLSTDIADRAATVGAIRELVSSLIDQVRKLKAALDDARDHADEFGLSITDGGAVIDGPRAGSAELVASTVGGTAVAAAAQAAKEEARAEIATRVQAILMIAADVETDTTAILSTAASGGFTGGSLSVEDASEKGQSEADDMFAAPAPPSDRGGQRAWAEALSADQLGEAADNYPKEMANAYQVPPWARERAAWNYHSDLREELTEQVVLLEQQRHDAVMMDERARVWNKLQTVQQQLRDLDQIETSVRNGDDLHLLGLRPHENGVGAIVAQGDIAEADQVTVHVPGMGSQTEVKPDAGNNLPGEINKMQTLNSAMQASLNREGRAHETIANVTYMNMDFPDFLTQASSPGYADSAAPDLGNALAGIKATGPDDSNLTVLGHSYGSLTTSEALQNGGYADNVVFYGSPGLESSDQEFDSSSLAVPEGNRYIMLAREDLIRPIGHLAPFGGPPADAPGLERLDTNHHRMLPNGSPTDLLGESRGHSEYDNKKTTSQWNMAAIATGVPDNVIPYDESEQTRGAGHYRDTIYPGLGLSGVR